MYTCRSVFHTESQQIGREADVVGMKSDTKGIIMADSVMFTRKGET